METAKFRHNFHKSIVNQAGRVQFLKMKLKSQTVTPCTWYERIWNKIELVNTNPDLDSTLRFLSLKVKVLRNAPLISND